MRNRIYDNPQKCRADKEDVLVNTLTNKPEKYCPKEISTNPEDIDDACHVCKDSKGIALFIIQENSDYSRNWFYPEF